MLKQGVYCDRTLRGGSSSGAILYNPKLTISLNSFVMEIKLIKFLKRSVQNELTKMRYGKDLVSILATVMKIGRVGY